ncbi:MAG: (2Fe-2S)-binding protein, partial [Pseudomonadota bacterium]
LDPFSGQPASKNVAVNLGPEAMDAYAFMLTREKPHLSDPAISYWATAKCVGGWRTELAFKGIGQAMSFGDKLATGSNGDQTLDYNDPVSHAHRVAVFDRGRLEMAFYMSPEPVMLSREWLVEQLQSTFDLAADRQRVLAGRADANLPDKGPIVCSCMTVGTNEILEAIHAGHSTVTSIGEATQAGTNCGSCRSELQALIERTPRPVAAE